jgi:hypothetical protein
MTTSMFVYIIHISHIKYGVKSELAYIYTHIHTYAQHTYLTETHTYIQIRHIKYGVKAEYAKAFGRSILSE